MPRKIRRKTESISWEVVDVLKLQEGIDRSAFRAAVTETMPGFDRLPTDDQGWVVDSAMSTLALSTMMARQASSLPSLAEQRASLQRLADAFESVRVARNSLDTDARFRLCVAAGISPGGEEPARAGNAKGTDEGLALHGLEKWRVLEAAMAHASDWVDAATAMMPAHEKRSAPAGLNELIVGLGDLFERFSGNKVSRSTNAGGFLEFTKAIAGFAPELASITGDQIDHAARRSIAEGLWKPAQP